MKKSHAIFLIVLSAFISSIQVHGQSVFSEKELDYKKTFLPYDVPYTFSLPEKEFIMLREHKKNVMILGKYDQYFFEKWEKEVEFNKEENVPQIFVRRDTVVTYSLTPIKDKKQIRLSFRYFSTKDGSEFQPTNYVIAAALNESSDPIISFSEDKSKFLIYNYLAPGDGDPMTEFQIFKIGSETPLNSYPLNPALLADPQAKSVKLSNNGDLFLVIVDPIEFKTETYFWRATGAEAVKVESNFFLERPPEKIGDINIVQQGASSYFITFSGDIEDELIGFGIVGVNVVLKTVMFSYNQNFNKDEITSAYENFIVTSEKQKKKNVEVPEVLKDFRLVQSFENEENDVILVFEELELPSEFNTTELNELMPWKFKAKEDKFYYGGDMMMYCFTEAGIKKWSKTIQKSQFSQGNGLGNSYIPFISGNELSILCSESAKDGNLYMLRINTIDGLLTEKINLLPDRNLDFAKKYSCWLNKNALIACGISATNAAKRNLMLVEF